MTIKKITSDQNDETIQNTTDDQRFGLAIRDFELTVPADYVHNVQIDKFARLVRSQKTTHDFNSHITSRNFASATNELVPGRTYGVKIFPIQDSAVCSPEDCLIFLKKQKAILASAQGLTLVSQLKRDELPKDKWTVSFDKEEALPSIVDRHMVSFVFAYSIGELFRWHITSFEGFWCSRHCLLCFCDPE